MASNQSVAGRGLQQPLKSLLFLFSFSFYPLSLSSSSSSFSSLFSRRQTLGLIHAPFEPHSLQKKKKESAKTNKRENCEEEKELIVIIIGIAVVDFVCCLFRFVRCGSEFYSFGFPLDSTHSHIPSFSSSSRHHHPPYTSAPLSPLHSVLVSPTGRIESTAAAATATAVSEERR